MAQQRQLYGGAMTFELPDRFVDMSTFRQVPRHQEAFMDANTDQSMIVELNEMVAVANEEAAAYHFEDLMEANKASSHEVCETQMIPLAELDSSLPADAYCVMLLGRERVSKFNEAAENDVNVVMTLVRLPSVTTDMLFIMYSPTRIHPFSSVAANVRSEPQPTPDESRAMYEHALCSFCVRSWALFG
eukprot:TRINITY_DN26168_c0_g1_i1.p2 TRINITY_DN26168_c0_g1~~TRINITY_DN26168_c0_g1_i1.p2  ORF type:complete len:188 (-),score=52.85 TRINITY_DN26168_c0_g1_i1:18-581(-)